MDIFERLLDENNIRIISVPNNMNFENLRSTHHNGLYIVIHYLHEELVGPNEEGQWMNQCSKSRNFLEPKEEHHILPSNNY